MQTKIAQPNDWNETGTILVTAIIAEIPYGPDGDGSAFHAALAAAGEYVADSPEGGEAAFTFHRREYRVSASDATDSR